ncbi:hypothetical protein DCE79_17345 [Lysinibacillus sp. 2017]|uniref:hypothetical protein n=1 Tax=unclassified Lysinibacillus TaxID=2636778 RepID=UPI000D527B64|nr:MULTISPECIES: hypothetical protein [unclassified Lysinibacillus]AWE08997.1 hypothetical protein DCE79_17345 [Lysinibacillus sp. 2017]TGN35494.1 hypothetical protein E4L99_09270 [Lysinibacillus sp. S2017]
MNTNYEALLKEQVMQQILGNDSRNLQSAAQFLITQHKEDQHQIMKAYQKVNTEIFGDLV